VPGKLFERNISAKERVGYFELKKHKSWLNRGAKIIRFEERGYVAVVAGSN
jgi:hypothetical protein